MNEEKRYVKSWSADQLYLSSTSQHEGLWERFHHPNLSERGELGGRWAFAVALSLLVERIVSVLSDTNSSFMLRVDSQHSEPVVCYFMGCGDAPACDEQYGKDASHGPQDKPCER